VTDRPKVGESDDDDDDIDVDTTGDDQSLLNAWTWVILHDAGTELKIVLGR
jgi:hypothetical protein